MTYVIANWKMHKTTAEALTWLDQVLPRLKGSVQTTSVVCPPFTAIAPVARAAAGSALIVGAQTMHEEEEGAFTGEVSGPMLCEAGARYVLLGHSERRLIAAETDRAVGRKLLAAQRYGLRPVYCVGENSEDHTRRDVAASLRRQYGIGLKDATAELLQSLIIAYEPIWAIGSGLAAIPEQAQDAAASIRAGLVTLFGHEAAAQVPILYGGSVTADNVAGYLQEPDIAGVLVGSAALDAEAFLGICEEATP